MSHEASVDPRAGQSRSPQPAPEDRSDLGTRVRELRLGRGWTLAAAAERMGVDQRQLQRIEAGHADVKVSTLLRVADGLGQTPAVLLPRSKPSTAVPASSSAEPETAPAASPAIKPPRHVPPPRDPDRIMVNIGARIVALRLSQRLSQADLARKAGLSLTLVQSVESARKSATIRSLALLAAVLDVDLAALLVPPSATPGTKSKTKPRVRRK